MATKIIQADREDIRTVEKESQNLFIFDILAMCGIPEEQLVPCFPGVDGMSIAQRMALRKLCSQYDVFIVDDFDGGVKIYVNDDIIAEWKKPHYVMRTDPTAKEKSKRIYVEIHCSWWSLFEEQNDQE